jgi:hypothetical protein
MPIAQVFVDEMATLKGQQLHATRSSTEHDGVLAAMRERGSRYLQEFEEFLAAREPLLQAAQMPLTAVMQLARRWVDEFVSETWGRAQVGQHLPDDLVGSLPDAVRVFYTPLERV